MSSLDGIGIQVRYDVAGDVSTGNVLPVLHQIRHALADLADGGDPTAIDLAAIPFAPGDRDRLLEALGPGEVSAVINALGESRVSETAFPGVWLVEHFAPAGDELGILIEVTRLPSLLATPEADIADSLARLGDRLAHDDFPATKERQPTIFSATNPAKE